MSKLLAYTDNLLVEKVSKKEIDIALKNKEILVGCEFEFISYELENTTVTDTEGYDDAYKAWSDYKTVLIKFGKEYEEFGEKIWKTEEKADTLENEDLPEVEYEITDVEDDEEMIELTKNRKLKELEKKKEEITDKISELRQDFEDLESERDSLDLSRYIDLDPYVSYMENYSGPDPTKEFDKWIWAIENWYSESGYLPRPEEEWSENQGSGRIEEIDFSDAPFDNYEIGGYGDIEQHVGSEVWGIEDDSSLGEDGIEIKSPPTSLPDALKDIEDMFEWIESGRGHTDDRCGFHVHMSIKGINNLEKVLDPVKIILFMDEGYIWNLFPDRKANTYVKSIKQKLKSEGDIHKVEWSKMINVNKAKAKIFSDHFDAINFQNMDSGHIEFRYMGSMNYSKRFKEIKAIIGQYAHNLALACDVNYKRKEYFLKLQRIFNKMEMMKLRWERETITILLNDEDEPLGVREKKILTKRVKEINLTLRNLPYTIDKTTIKTVLNNSSFMLGVYDELKKRINGLVNYSVVDDMVLRYAISIKSAGKK